MAMRSKPAPDRPDLEQLLILAQARWDAMTPKQQGLMRAASRKSWVVGELMIDRPHLEKAAAEEIYEKVVEGRGL
jgi:hypothetical protein